MMRKFYQFLSDYLNLVFVHGKKLLNKCQSLMFNVSWVLFWYFALAASFFRFFSLASTTRYVSRFRQWWFVTRNCVRSFFLLRSLFMFTNKFPMALNSSLLEFTNNNQSFFGGDSFSGYPFSWLNITMVYRYISQNNYFLRWETVQKYYPHLVAELNKELPFYLQQDLVRLQLFSGEPLVISLALLNKLDHVLFDEFQYFLLQQIRVSDPFVLFHFLHSEQYQYFLVHKFFENHFFYILSRYNTVNQLTFYVDQPLDSVGLTTQLFDKSNLINSPAGFEFFYTLLGERILMSMYWNLFVAMGNLPHGNLVFYSFWLRPWHALGMWEILCFIIPLITGFWYLFYFRCDYFSYALEAAWPIKGQLQSEEYPNYARWRQKWRGLLVQFFTFFNLQVPEALQVTFARRSYRYQRDFLVAKTGHSIFNFKSVDFILWCCFLFFFLRGVDFFKIGYSRKSFSRVLFRFRHDFDRRYESQYLTAVSPILAFAEAREGRSWRRGFVPLQKLGEHSLVWKSKLAKFSWTPYKSRKRTARLARLERVLLQYLRRFRHFPFHNNKRLKSRLYKQLRRNSLPIFNIDWHISKARSVVLTEDRLTSDVHEIRARPRMYGGYLRAGADERFDLFSLLVAPDTFLSSTQLKLTSFNLILPQTYQRLFQKVRSVGLKGIFDCFDIIQHFSETPSLKAVEFPDRSLTMQELRLLPGVDYVKLFNRDPALSVNQFNNLFWINCYTRLRLDNSRISQIFFNYRWQQLNTLSNTVFFDKITMERSNIQPNLVFQPKKFVRFFTFYDRHLRFNFGYAHMSLPMVFGERLTTVTRRFLRGFTGLRLSAPATRQQNTVGFDNYLQQRLIHPFRRGKQNSVALSRYRNIRRRQRHRTLSAFLTTDRQAEYGYRTQPLPFGRIRKYRLRGTFYRAQLRNQSTISIRRLLRHKRVWRLSQALRLKQLTLLPDMIQRQYQQGAVYPFIVPGSRQLKVQNAIFTRQSRRRLSDRAFRKNSVVYSKEERVFLVLLMRRKRKWRRRLRNFIFFSRPYVRFSRTSGVRTRLRNIQNYNRRAVLRTLLIPDRRKGLLARFKYIPRRLVKRLRRLGLGTLSQLRRRVILPTTSLVKFLRKRGRYRKQRNSLRRRFDFNYVNNINHYYGKKFLKKRYRYKNKKVALARKRYDPRLRRLTRKLWSVKRRRRNKRLFHNPYVLRQRAIQRRAKRWASRYFLLLGYKHRKRRDRRRPLVGLFLVNRLRNAIKTNIRLKNSQLFRSARFSKHLQKRLVNYLQEHSLPDFWARSLKLRKHLLLFQKMSFFRQNRFALRSFFETNGRLHLVRKQNYLKKVGYAALREQWRQVAVNASAKLSNADTFGSIPIPRLTKTMAASSLVPNSFFYSLGRQSSYPWMRDSMEMISTRLTRFFSTKFLYLRRRSRAAIQPGIPASAQYSLYYSFGQTQGRQFFRVATPVLQFSNSIINWNELFLNNRFSIRSCFEETVKVLGDPYSRSTRTYISQRELPIDFSLQTKQDYLTIRPAYWRSIQYLLRRNRSANHTRDLTLQYDDDRLFHLFPYRLGRTKLHRFSQRIAKNRYMVIEFMRKGWFELFNDFCRDWEIYHNIQAGSRSDIIDRSFLLRTRSYDPHFRLLKRGYVSDFAVLHETAAHQFHITSLFPQFVTPWRSQFRVKKLVRLLAVPLSLNSNIANFTYGKLRYQRRLYPLQEVVAGMKETAVGLNSFGLFRISSFLKKFIFQSRSNFQFKKSFRFLRRTRVFRGAVTSYFTQPLWKLRVYRARHDRKYQFFRERQAVGKAPQTFFAFGRHDSTVVDSIKLRSMSSARLAGRARSLPSIGRGFRLGAAKAGFRHHPLRQFSARLFYNYKSTRNLTPLYFRSSLFSRTKYYLTYQQELLASQLVQYFNPSKLSRLYSVAPYLLKMRRRKNWRYRRRFLRRTIYLMSNRLRNRNKRYRRDHKIRWLYHQATKHLRYSFLKNKIDTSYLPRRSFSFQYTSVEQFPRLKQRSVVLAVHNFAEYATPRWRDLMGLLDSFTYYQYSFKLAKKKHRNVLSPEGRDHLFKFNKYRINEELTGYTGTVSKEFDARIFSHRRKVQFLWDYLPFTVDIRLFRSGRRRKARSFYRLRRFLATNFGVRIRKRLKNVRGGGRARTSARLRWVLFSQQIISNSLVRNNFQSFLKYHRFLRLNVAVFDRRVKGTRASNRTFRRQVVHLQSITKLLRSVTRGFFDFRNRRDLVTGVSGRPVFTAGQSIMRYYRSGNVARASRFLHGSLMSTSFKFPSMRYTFSMYCRQFLNLTRLGDSLALVNFRYYHPEKTVQSLANYDLRFQLARNLLELQKYRNRGARPLVRVPAGLFNGLGVAKMQQYWAPYRRMSFDFPLAKNRLFGRPIRFRGKALRYKKAKASRRSFRKVARVRGLLLNYIRGQNEIRRDYLRRFSGRFTTIQRSNYFRNNPFYFFRYFQLKGWPKLGRVRRFKSTVTLTDFIGQQHPSFQDFFDFQKPLYLLKHRYSRALDRRLLHIPDVDEFNFDRRTLRPMLQIPLQPARTASREQRFLFYHNKLRKRLSAYSKLQQKKLRKSEKLFLRQLGDFFFGSGILGRTRVQYHSGAPFTSATFLKSLRFLRQKKYNLYFQSAKKMRHSLFFRQARFARLLKGLTHSGRDLFRGQKQRSSRIQLSLLKFQTYQQKVNTQKRLLKKKRFLNRSINWKQQRFRASKAWRRWCLRWCLGVPGVINFSQVFNKRKYRHIYYKARHRQLDTQESLSRFFTHKASRKTTSRSAKRVPRRYDSLDYTNKKVFGVLRRNLDELGYYKIPGFFHNNDRVKRQFPQRFNYKYFRSYPQLLLDAPEFFRFRAARLKRSLFIGHSRRRRAKPTLLLDTPIIRSKDQKALFTISQHLGLFTDPRSKSLRYRWLARFKKRQFFRYKKSNFFSLRGKYPKRALVSYLRDRQLGRANLLTNEVRRELRSNVWRRRPSDLQNLRATQAVRRVTRSSKYFANWSKTRFNAKPLYVFLPAYHQRWLARRRQKTYKKLSQQFFSKHLLLPTSRLLKGTQIHVAAAQRLRKYRRGFGHIYQRTARGRRVLLPRRFNNRYLLWQRHRGYNLKYSLQLRRLKRQLQLRSAVYKTQQKQRVLHNINSLWVYRLKRFKPTVSRSLWQYVLPRVYNKIFFARIPHEHKQLRRFHRRLWPLLKHFNYYKYRTNSRYLKTLQAGQFGVKQLYKPPSIKKRGNSLFVLLAKPSEFERRVLRSRQLYSNVSPLTRVFRSEADDADFVSRYDLARLRYGRAILTQRTRANRLLFLEKQSIKRVDNINRRYYAIFNNSHIRYENYSYYNIPVVGRNRHYTRRSQYRLLNRVIRGQLPVLSKFPRKSITTRFLVRRRRFLQRVLQKFYSNAEGPLNRLVVVQPLEKFTDRSTRLLYKNHQERTRSFHHEMYNHVFSQFRNKNSLFWDLSREPSSEPFVNKTIFADFRSRIRTRPWSKPERGRFFSESLKSLPQRYRRKHVSEEVGFFRSHNKRHTILQSKSRFRSRDWIGKRLSPRYVRDLVYFQNFIKLSGPQKVTSARTLSNFVDLNAYTDKMQAAVLTGLENGKSSFFDVHYRTTAQGDLRINNIWQQFYTAQQKNIIFKLHGAAGIPLAWTFLLKRENFVHVPGYISGHWNQLTDVFDSVYGKSSHVLLWLLSGYTTSKSLFSKEMFVAQILTHTLGLTTGTPVFDISYIFAYWGAAWWEALMAIFTTKGVPLVLPVSSGLEEPMYFRRVVSRYYVQHEKIMFVNAATRYFGIPELTEFQSFKKVSRVFPLKKLYVRPTPAAMKYRTFLNDFFWLDCELRRSVAENYVSAVRDYAIPVSTKRGALRKHLPLGLKTSILLRTMMPKIIGLKNPIVRDGIMIRVQDIRSFVLNSENVSPWIIFYPERTYKPQLLRLQYSSWVADNRLLRRTQLMFALRQRPVSGIALQRIPHDFFLFYKQKYRSLQDKLLAEIFAKNFPLLGRPLRLLFRHFQQTMDPFVAGTTRVAYQTFARHIQQDYAYRFLRNHRNLRLYTHENLQFDRFFDLVLKTSQLSLAQVLIPPNQHASGEVSLLTNRFRNVIGKTLFARRLGLDRFIRYSLDLQTARRRHRDETNQFFYSARAKQLFRHIQYLQSKNDLYELFLLSFLYTGDDLAREMGRIFNLSQQQLLTHVLTREVDSQFFFGRPYDYGFLARMYSDLVVNVHPYMFRNVPSMALTFVRQPPGYITNVAPAYETAVRGLYQSAQTSVKQILFPTKQNSARGAAYRLMSNHVKQVRDEGKNVPLSRTQSQGNVDNTIPRYSLPVPHIQPIRDDAEEIMELFHSIQQELSSNSGSLITDISDEKNDDHESFTTAGSPVQASTPQNFVEAECTVRPDGVRRVDDDGSVEALRQRYVFSPDTSVIDTPVRSQTPSLSSESEYQLQDISNNNMPMSPVSISSSGHFSMLAGNLSPREPTALDLQEIYELAAGKAPVSLLWDDLSTFIAVGIYKDEQKDTNIIRHLATMFQPNLFRFFYSHAQIDWELRDWQNYHLYPYSFTLINRQALRSSAADIKFRALVKADLKIFVDELFNKFIELYFNQIGQLHLTADVLTLWNRSLELIKQDRLHILQQYCDKLLETDIVSITDLIDMVKPYRFKGYRPLRDAGLRRHFSRLGFFNLTEHAETLNDVELAFDYVAESIAVSFWSSVGRKTGMFRDYVDHLHQLFIYLAKTGQYANFKKYLVSELMLLRTNYDYNSRFAVVTNYLEMNNNQLEVPSVTDLLDPAARSNFMEQERMHELLKLLQLLEKDNFSDNLSGPLVLRYAKLLLADIREYQDFTAGSAEQRFTRHRIRSENLSIASVILRGIAPLVGNSSQDRNFVARLIILNNLMLNSSFRVHSVSLRGMPAQNTADLWWQAGNTFEFYFLNKCVKFYKLCWEFEEPGDEFSSFLEKLSFLARSYHINDYDPEQLLDANDLFMPTSTFSAFLQQLYPIVRAGSSRMHGISKPPRARLFAQNPELYKNRLARVSQGIRLGQFKKLKNPAAISSFETSIAILRSNASDEVLSDELMKIYTLQQLTTMRQAQQRKTLFPNFFFNAIPIRDLSAVKNCEYFQQWAGLVANLDLTKLEDVFEFFKYLRFIRHRPGWFYISPTFVEESLTESCQLTGDLRVIIFQNNLLDGALGRIIELMDPLAIEVDILENTIIQKPLPFDNEDLAILAENTTLIEHMGSINETENAFSELLLNAYPVYPFIVVDPTNLILEVDPLNLNNDSVQSEPVAANHIDWVPEEISNIPQSDIDFLKNLPRSEVFVAREQRLKQEEDRRRQLALETSVNQSQAVWEVHVENGKVKISFPPTESSAPRLGLSNPVPVQSAPQVTFDSLVSWLKTSGQEPILAAGGLPEGKSEAARQAVTPSPVLGVLGEQIARENSTGSDMAKPENPPASSSPVMIDEPSLTKKHDELENECHLSRSNSDSGLSTFTTLTEFEEKWVANTTGDAQESWNRSQLLNYKVKMTLHLWIKFRSYFGVRLIGSINLSNLVPGYHHYQLWDDALLGESVAIDEAEIIPRTFVFEPDNSIIFDSIPTIYEGDGNDDDDEDSMLIVFPDLIANDGSANDIASGLSTSFPVKVCISSALWRIRESQLIVINENNRFEDVNLLVTSRFIHHSTTNPKIIELYAKIKYNAAAINDQVSLRTFSRQVLYHQALLGLRTPRDGALNGPTTGGPICCGPSYDIVRDVFIDSLQGLTVVWDSELRVLDARFFLPFTLDLLTSGQRNLIDFVFDSRHKFGVLYLTDQALDDIWPTPESYIVMSERYRQGGLSAVFNGLNIALGIPVPIEHVQLFRERIIAARKRRGELPRPLPSSLLHSIEQVATHTSGEEFDFYLKQFSSYVPPPQAAIGKSEPTAIANRREQLTRLQGLVQQERHRRRPSDRPRLVPVPFEVENFSSYTSLMQTPSDSKFATIAPIIHRRPDVQMRPTYILPDLPPIPSTLPIFNSERLPAADPDTKK